MITGAVHHVLVQNGLRHHASIIVNGGDIIETHHCATLIGYGADAIYPSLAYETIISMYDRALLESVPSPRKAISIYVKALEKGILKIMSKLGVSTVQSYRGAQAFEALGIAPEVITKCFKGTVSRIKGMTFDMLAREALIKHRLAFDPTYDQTLVDMGI